MIRTILDRIADRLGYAPKAETKGNPAEVLGGMFKELRQRIEKLEARQVGTSITYAPAYDKHKANAEKQLEDFVWSVRRDA